jgi:hypothetical protein
VLAVLLVLAVPASGRADPRLPLGELKLNTQLMLEEPASVRWLSARAQAAAVEAARNRIFRVQALNWTYELRFYSMAAAMDRAIDGLSPAKLAQPSSVPAGAIDRGPSAIHQKVIRLPRVHF